MIISTNYDFFVACCIDIMELTLGTNVDFSMKDLIGISAVYRNAISAFISYRK